MRIIRILPYEVLLNKKHLDNYDLIIIPCNYMMEPINIEYNNIIEKASITKLNNYIINNYKYYINDGDIRITPGFDIKPNLMFVKYPFHSKRIGINNYLEVFKDILDKIEINEYKKVLLPLPNNAFHYGFSRDETLKIDKIIHHLIERNDSFNKEIQFDEIYLTKS